MALTVRCLKSFLRSLLKQVDGLLGGWGVSVWVINRDPQCFYLSSSDTGTSEGGVDEVLRGRCTWNQIYFARGSCVKSLQRTCKA